MAGTELGWDFFKRERFAVLGSVALHIFFIVAFCNSTVVHVQPWQQTDSPVFFATVLPAEEPESKPSFVEGKIRRSAALPSTATSVVGKSSDTKNSLAQPLNPYVEYLPKSALHVVPVPASEISIPFPKGIAGAVDATVVFDVYIDEAGIVRRVVPETEGVSPEFTEAAAKAFGNARFSPGLLDGVFVKSYIRVSVEFFQSF